MASEVEICNLGLGHIGEKPISSINPPDPNERARACQRVYPTAKNATLRGKDWNFARVIEYLLPLADVSVPGWEYAYAYPTKCECVRRVFTDSESPDPKGVDYQVLLIPSINRKVIVCNFDQALVRYTYQVEDAELWDSDFCEAVSYKLASLLVPSLKGNDDQLLNLMKIYQALISDSARINDGEGQNTANADISTVDARG